MKTNINEKFKKSAFIACDIVIMPFRALWHDFKKSRSLKTSAPLLTNLLISFCPVYAGIASKALVGPMPMLTIPLTTFFIGAVAWEHPVTALERREWERFPLYKNKKAALT